MIITGIAFVIGTSIYPMCPVGRVAIWFVEFCIRVAQVSGLSSVKNLYKVECCTEFSREVGVWNHRKELILWCSLKM